MNIPQLISLALFSLVSINAGAQQQNAGNYGHTILSVSPVQVSERTLTGFGIQYERFIGMSGKFSLYLPLAYSFGQSRPLVRRQYDNEPCVVRGPVHVEGRIGWIGPI
ncbi:MAG: hypothetical protein ACHQVK_03765, partial [Candidatus Paceibacterales bacterium]